MQSNLGDTVLDVQIEHHDYQNLGCIGHLVKPKLSARHFVRVIDEGVSLLE
jgi:hypothetical protein